MEIVLPPAPARIYQSGKHPSNPAQPREQSKNQPLMAFHMTWATCRPPSGATSTNTHTHPHHPSRSVPPPSLSTARFTHKRERKPYLAWDPCLCLFSGHPETATWSRTALTKPCWSTILARLGRRSHRKDTGDACFRSIDCCLYTRFCRPTTVKTGQNFPSRLENTKWSVFLVNFKNNSNLFLISFDKICLEPTKRWTLIFYSVVKYKKLLSGP